MKSRITIATLFVVLAFQAIASEATHRESNVSELQTALGFDVVTSELNIDAPMYARFVLVTVDKGVTKEAILADLDFPATYFRFLNVTDCRALLDPNSGSNAKMRRYIRMTTWIGKDHRSPQGRTFEFSELEVGSPCSGSTNYLEPNNKVDVKNEIVVWDDSKVNSDNNSRASQKLVLRLSPEKPAPTQ